MDSLAALPRERKHFVRLEELHDDPQSVARLFGFLGLHCRKDTAALFARPHNVNRPEDKLLDVRQRVQFDAIAYAMMERLGYAETPEYVVNY